MEKRYIVKMYSKAGVYLGTKNPLKIKSDVSFKSVINGGQGECVIDINDPVDSFDEGVTIDHANVAKIYQSDDVNSLAPRLIYTGYVSKYEAYNADKDEGVRVTLLGLVSMLSLSFFKNGASYTNTQTTVDPNAMMKAIVDHWASVSGLAAWIGYGGGHALDVGAVATKAFVDRRWSDAMADAFALGGGGRWWRIAEDGQLWHQPKPSSPTHRFNYDGHVIKSSIVKSNETVINDVEVRPGSPATNADYSDSGSQTTYGLRTGDPISDATITDNTTRDAAGNGKIADGKTATVNATLTIGTSYDIESVKVGQTCSLLGMKKGSLTCPANLLITAVKYTPDSIEIQCETLLTYFAAQFVASVQKIA